MRVPERESIMVKKKIILEGNWVSLTIREKIEVRKWGEVVRTQSPPQVMSSRKAPPPKAAITSEPPQTGPPAGTTSFNTTACWGC